MYGYLYWTFFTLAYEQALKAWEMAIVCKLEDASIEKMPNKLIDKIKKLKNLNIINNLEERALPYNSHYQKSIGPSEISERTRSHQWIFASCSRANQFCLYMLDRGI